MNTVETAIAELLSQAELQSISNKFISHIVVDSSDKSDFSHALYSLLVLTSSYLWAQEPQRDPIADLFEVSGFQDQSQITNRCNWEHDPYCYDLL